MFSRPSSLVARNGGVELAAKAWHSNESYQAGIFKLTRAATEVNEKASAMGLFYQSTGKWGALRL
jgi:hypothetical protein